MHTGRPSVRSIIANISFQASFKGGDTGVSFRRVWTLYSLSWNSDFLLVAPFASQVNFPRCLAVWGQDLEQGPRYNVGGWFWRLFSLLSCTDILVKTNKKNTVVVFFCLFYDQIYLTDILIYLICTVFSVCTLLIGVISAWNPPNWIQISGINPPWKTKISH